ncbi:calcium-binding protein [Gemmobacter denitrificans]|uniref:Calcium-binding protein n=1 Tax=Gemmobacter denitrificans TaxID=3123040 RepID=A0ABU8BPU8_9RHOB
MAAITMEFPMNTVQFLLGSLTAVTQVSGGGNNVTVTHGSDLELVFTGQGLSLDGLDPVAGRVSRIDAYQLIDGITTLVGTLEVSDPEGWLFSRDGLHAGYRAEGHRISGSAGFDVISGGAGADRVFPRGGEDRIFAGAGNDKVSIEAFVLGGVAPPMEVDGGTGRDELEIFGSQGKIDLRSVQISGFETISADTGTVITLGAQQLLDIGSIGFFGTGVTWRVIQSAARLDLRPIDSVVFDLLQFELVGRNGADVQFAHDQIGAVMKGRGGADRLTGGNGRDDLYGGAQSDRLVGRDGADNLIGGLGADTLIGGEGNDRLWGGSGRDLFVFGAESGEDEIVDFSAFGPTSDRIDLRGVAGITGFRDLMRNHLVVDGDDLILQLGGANRVELENTARADLDAGDFLFSS